MRKVLAALGGIAAVLLLCGLASAIWPMSVGMALFDTVGPWVWPVIEPHLKTFPPSPNREASIAGSHPVAACQRSHVDFGETVRGNQSLDGVWEIGEGALSDTPPPQFDHTVPVPGLVTEAWPRLDAVGIESDDREAFWYRTRFVAPESGPGRAQAFLCLHKAKYGVKTWLNGVALGEHYGAFTVSEYDLTRSVHWGAENELLVRVGADRSRIPDFVPVGSDQEKGRWFPGLWDSVTVVYTGEHSIVRIKVEPDVERGVARIRTLLRNGTGQAARLDVKHEVAAWASPSVPAASVDAGIDVPAGETREVVREVSLPDARLWTPDEPALQRLHTTVHHQGAATDDRVVRFGMREVEWRGGEDGGFFLNGRRYPLRGTNIAFHRFLEDQDRGLLPWERPWVERLLGELPKEIGWNSLRFHVGRAPNLWYDVADEVGLIVTDEFHVFAPFAPGSEVAQWSLVEMQKEYTGWVRESWNHPSIGWWDASNETNSPLPYELVPRLRALDETRAWESGSYGAPDRVDDPLEEHPYILNGASFMNPNERNYTLSDLDHHPGRPPLKAGTGVFSTWNAPDAGNHPYINNEYGWLWHTRDGRKPTPLTRKAFERLSGGAELSAEERREMYAYVISELTGLWRTRRGYAGVQHFLYLGKCTDPETVRDDWEPKDASHTCDNFVDVPNLVLEPRWRRYARDAFAPVAIYLERWSDAFYERGERVEVPVTVINDEHEPVRGRIRLIAASSDGQPLATSAEHEVVVPAIGREETLLAIDIPDEPGFVLYAEITTPGRPTATSRRKIGLRHPGVSIAPRPTAPTAP